MSTDLDFYMQQQPGGIDPNPPGTMIDHYGWRFLGPEDDKDAVIFSAPIDTSVVPTSGSLRYLPKGRIFSMTAQGTMIPGLVDTNLCPVTGILIGSDSDSGDVVGVNYGDPATVSSGSSAFKDSFTAPFQSLAAGYVYETTEFDPAQITQLVPGTLLTTTLDNINNFDTAGLLKVGRAYVDHIIGVVIRGLGPMTMNHDKQCIVFQGLSIPRLNKDAVNAANLRA